MNKSEPKSHDRRRELFAAVDEMTRVHREWTLDNNRPNPDVPYWDTVTALISTFDTGDIPGDCRELAIAVESLAVELGKFDDRDDINSHYPHDGFWNARQAVQDTRDSVERTTEIRPLEPIAELLKLPMMTREQVARMWGFVDRKGNAMPWLIDKELEKPGSVTEAPGAVDGRDWEDPRLAQRRRAEADTTRRYAEAMQAKQQAAQHGQQNQPGQQAQHADRPACPESPEQLWEQGVSPQQSARMLGLPLSQVEAMFVDFAQQKEEERISKAGQQISEQKQAETEILELAAEGMEPEKIAKEVGKSLRYVKTVLKTKQPATA